MRHNKKAFTLVEMLVALAVSAVIISATYASFELIQKQYKKNIDVTQLHTSGRAVMQILEREIRMAGYEFRDGNGVMTYGNIVGPLVLIDSGDKCCDEATIIYDEVTDTLNAQGAVTSSVVDRIKTRFWTEAHSSSKRGSRFRLYKRRTIVGTNNALLATPVIGAREVMADYIEDLQLTNISTTGTLYGGAGGLSSIKIWNPTKPKNQKEVGSIRNSGNIHALAFGPDGLLYGGNGAVSRITTWDPTKPKNQKEVGSINNSPYIHALAFGPNGLLYGGSGGLSKITIWDPTKPKNQKEVGAINNSGNIHALAFGPDGLLYGGAGGLNSIKIWDPSKPKNQKEVGSIRNSGNIHALAFSPDGLLYGGSGGLNSIKIWNPTKPKNQKEVGSIRNSGNIHALAFGPDGLLYGGAGGLNSIKIWDPSKPKNQKEVDSIRNSGNLHALAFYIKKTGTNSVVSINLTLRSKEKYGKNKTFLKKDYLSGNFNFSKNDQYQRDTFSTTVSVRNL